MYISFARNKFVSHCATDRPACYDSSNGRCSVDNSSSNKYVYRSNISRFYRPLYRQTFQLKFLEVERSLKMAFVKMTLQWKFCDNYYYYYCFPFAERLQCTDFFSSVSSSVFLAFKVTIFSQLCLNTLYRRFMFRLVGVRLTVTLLQ